MSQSPALHPACNRGSDLMRSILWSMVARGADVGYLERGDRGTGPVDYSWGSQRAGRVDRQHEFRREMRVGQPLTVARYRRDHVRGLAIDRNLPCPLQ